MGPAVAVVAIGGIMVAGTVTKAQVERLKAEINRILDRYKPDIDRFKELQGLLKEFDVQNILKNLSKLNQEGFLTLKDFFLEIEKQLKMLQKARVKEFGGDEMSGVLSWVGHFANIGISLLSLAPLFSEAPPVAVVLAVIGAILTVIFTCIQIFTDIKQIGELNKKKEEIIEYFKDGGQFQQNQEKLLNASAQIIKNVYLSSVYSRQLFGQYFARLQLLSRGTVEGTTLVEFQEFQNIIKMNPFTWQFQKTIRKQYVQIKGIINSKTGLSSKVSSVCKILDHCVKKEGVIRKLVQLEKALELLTKKGSVIDQINQRFQMYRKINSVREQVQSRFKERASTSEQDKKKNDQDILLFLEMFLKRIPDYKLRAAQIISFFTDSFYGDDSSGMTVYSHSLKQLAKTSYELDKIRVVTDNHFYLPEPKRKDQWKFWVANKNALINMFEQANKELKIESFKSMFMRMNQEENKEAGITELKVNIGICLNIENQEDFVRFERPFQELAEVRWGEQPDRFIEEWKTILPTFPGLKKQIPKGPLFEGAGQTATPGKFPGMGSATSKGFTFPGVGQGPSAKPFMFPGTNKGPNAFPGVNNNLPTTPLFPGAETAIKIQGNLFPGAKLSFPQNFYVVNPQQKTLMVLSLSFETSASQNGGQSDRQNQQKKILPCIQVRSSQDINLLIQQVCLLINSVAYPERVKKFEIQKKGQKYEVVVQWSEETLDEKLLGKSMKGRSMKTREEYCPQKDGKQTFKLHNVKEDLVVCWYLQ